jgi:plasmid stabilization system protein ParE
MRLVLHEEALAEYRAAALRYANRSPVLALRFIDAVEQTLWSIVESPTSGRIVESDIRLRLTRVFPYKVLYALEPETIVIVAIAHCSRKPDYWRARRP